MAKYKLGLALGSGSARGWAHLGVLRALAEKGLKPDIVCGASIGSLVAAACASAQLDTLEDWVRGLGRMDVLRLLDARFTRGGVFAGSRVMHAVAAELEDHAIESLPIEFGAVATDLDTGREIWLREGSMLDAVRASSGFPGLFQPVRHPRGWLIDGGVVNPVPVSLCFALGADQVIAVNLNADRISRPKSLVLPASASVHSSPNRNEDAHVSPEELTHFDRFTAKLGNMWPFSTERDEATEPSMFEVVAATIAILQERVTRSRMVGEPPQVLLTPRLGHFQLMDFHRAAEAIEEGERCVARMDTELDYVKAALD